MNECTLRSLISIIRDIILEIALKECPNEELMPYYQKIFAITNIVDTNKELASTCSKLLDVVNECETAYCENFLDDVERDEIESLLLQ